MKPFNEMTAFEQWLISEIVGVAMEKNPITLSDKGSLTPDVVMITVDGLDVTEAVITQIGLLLTKSEDLTWQDGFKHGKLTALDTIIEHKTEALQNLIMED